MITIQELHTYHELSTKGLVPEFICPVDESDGPMIPWMNEKDEACFWCLACNSKLYLGIVQEDFIKSIIHPK